MSKEWTYGLVHQGDLREIDKKEVVVGRSRTCDIRIGEPSVSRKHFRLLVADGVITLQDLGSSNGSFVNDESVHDRQDLEHGDRVTIGDIDVFVHIERKADTRPFEGLNTRVLDQDALDALKPASAEPASVAPSDGDRPSEAPPSTPSTPPVADTWPIDEDPEPADAAGALAAAGPLATQRVSPDDLESPSPVPPGEVSPVEEATAIDVTVARRVPASLATQRFEPGELPEPTPDTPSADLHGTRLIAQDFLDVAPDPESLWSTPPPPASMTPPPIEFAPVPDIPHPKDEDPAPTPDEDLEATDTRRKAPSPAPAPAPADDPPPSLSPDPPGSTASPSNELADLPLSTRDAEVASGDVLGSVAGFDQTRVDGMTPIAPPSATPETPTPPKTTVRERSGIHARPPAAGFWIRALAMIAEAAWATVLGWGLARLLGTAEDPITRQSAYALAFIVVALVVLVGWSVWGTTPGKRLFRLYVCTAAGQPGVGPLRALVRAVGYLVSVLTLGIGFLIAASGNKRALHDRLAGTYVARLG